MLLSFSFQNYLSFKDLTRVSLLAGTIKEKVENIYSPYYTDEFKVLKSIGIYGANSSGKTNIIKGLSFMRDFVINSSRESNATQSIRVQPFKLVDGSDKRPTFFEIYIVIDAVKYKYGFIVNDKFVEGEWLMKMNKKKEENIFVRAKQDFHIDKKFRNDFKNKIDFLSELTRSNSLFLSVLSQFNIELAQGISTWFSNCIIAHDTDHLALIDFSAKLMEDVGYRKLFNDILKNAGLGIESVEERVKEISGRTNYSKDFLSNLFLDEIKNYSVKTKHNTYSEEGNKTSSVLFDLIDNESLGTQKFFGLLGPILLALKKQKVLIIDEIDARLHTLLLQKIVDLFNSIEYNPNGAQLIFTSHNTHILKNRLRRDQMIFIEKDAFGVSRLESLYNKNPKVRNDASFDKDYLEGKYGAIPFINSQLNLFD